MENQNFNLEAEFAPTKDQLNSINSLLKGLDSCKQQTLKGITGSGKTFVLGNVINESNKPSIILAPNKILAYQLYNELVKLFPNNFIGYYVSPYDLYKPTFYSKTLNKKVEGTVVINWANKILRSDVKSFLHSSEKAILVCSSTVIFPTFKDDLDGLIEKHKNYIIRRLNEEKIVQVYSFIKQGKKEEAKRLEKHIDKTVDELLVGYPINPDILALLSEKEKEFYITDYFVNNKANLYIDESHLALLQLQALPTANINRLKLLAEKGYYINNVVKDNVLDFNKLKERVNTITYISATPSEFELDNSEQVVELLTRPNGLVDPKITLKQEDYFGGQEMIKDIKNTISKNETVFINCISRNQVNNISKLLTNYKIENEIIHFKVKQDERKKILNKLREGKIQVIIGINMLREGIDVKQCSLVIVEQASRNNFLRTKSCLIQIAGRAARNKNGKVFMCCDTVSNSLSEAMKEINYRRKKQIEANEK